MIERRLVPITLHKDLPPLELYTAKGEVV